MLRDLVIMEDFVSMMGKATNVNVHQDIVENNAKNEVSLMLYYFLHDSSISKVEAIFPIREYI